LSWAVGCQSVGGSRKGGWFNLHCSCIRQALFKKGYPQVQVNLYKAFTNVREQQPKKISGFVNIPTEPHSVKSDLELIPPPATKTPNPQLMALTPQNQALQKPAWETSTIIGHLRQPHGELPKQPLSPLSSSSRDHHLGDQKCPRAWPCLTRNAALACVSQPSSWVTSTSDSTRMGVPRPDVVCCPSTNASAGWFRDGAIIHSIIKASDYRSG
jgi:hypothetical protein